MEIEDLEVGKEVFYLQNKNSTLQVKKDKIRKIHKENIAYHGTYHEVVDVFLEDFGEFLPSLLYGTFREANEVAINKTSLKIKELKEELALREARLLSLQGDAGET